MNFKFFKKLCKKLAQSRISSTICSLQSASWEMEEGEVGSITFSFAPRLEVYSCLHWTSFLIFYSGIMQVSWIRREDAGW